MEYLRVLISRSNLETLIDLMVNHGKVKPFQQLVAHHFAFFKNFNNLSALDVLLKYRRGFNLNIGSRYRKVYFSDVDKILKSGGETGIGGIIRLNQSESFNESERFKECFNVFHEVSSIEGVEIGMITNKEDPVYDLKDKIEKIDKENADKDNDKHLSLTDKFILSKGEHEEKKLKWNEFMKILSRLKKFGEFSPDKVFKPGEVDRIIFEKTVKEEAKLKAKMEFESVSGLKENNVEIVRKVFEGNLDQKMIGWYSVILDYCEKIEIFINNYEEMTEMFTDCYPSYLKMMSEKTEESRDNHSKKLQKYMDRKKELQFLYPGEISRSSCYLSLKEAKESYDSLLRNEVSERRLDRMNAKMSLSFSDDENEGPAPKTYDDRLLESKKEIEKYEVEVSSHEDLIYKIDNFLNPATFKSLYYLCSNTNGELDKSINSLTLGDSVETFLAKLSIYKEEVQRFADINKENPFDKKLESKIKEVNEVVKNYILDEVNNLRAPDKGRMREEYRKILKERKRVFETNEKTSMNDFQLNKFELNCLDHIIAYIKQDEGLYLRNKRYLRVKRGGEIYCEQNLRNYKNKKGVSDKLQQDEWHDEIFRIEKAGYEEIVVDFERALFDFEEICGFSPYGVIIGCESDIQSRLSSEKYNLEEEVSENKKIFRKSKDLTSERKAEIIKMNRKATDRIKVLNDREASLNASDCISIDAGKARSEKILYSKIVEGIKDVDIERDRVIDFKPLLMRSKRGGKEMDYNLHAKSVKLKSEWDRQEYYSKINETESKKIKGEEIFDLYIKSNAEGKWPMGGILRTQVESGESSKSKGWIKVNSGMKIHCGRKIENDLENRKALRRNSMSNSRYIVGKACLESKNIYEELEIEEAISDSSAVVDKIMESEISPYLCFDYKRCKIYRKKKMDYILKEKEAGVEGIDLVKKYNEFDIINNSNANKNYDVKGTIAYLKTLLSLRILKVNTKKSIYGKFGLKKCQSSYLINNFIQLARRMMKSNKDETGLNYKSF